MARMPNEPEAFSEHVAAMLQRMCPERRIVLGGVFEMHINGRHLGLDNLFRMVRGNPDRGVEIVEQFLDHLMQGEATADISMPFDIARARIMPRIQPSAVFDHLDREAVVYQPFVNDTVLMYVIDLPHLTVSITVEQLMQWDISLDEIDVLARSNLRDYSPHLEVKIRESDTGGRAATFTQRDGYDASRLLLGNLYARLAPELGPDFFVATPARDSFLAISHDPTSFADHMLGRIVLDFKRLPYPITDRYFIVTRDGVAGTVAA